MLKLKDKPNTGVDYVNVKCFLPFKHVSAIISTSKVVHKTLFKRIRLKIS